MIFKLPNGKKIGNGFPVYIIAEIGINHNGSYENAILLIDQAVKSGVDAVKFQKRNIIDIYSKKFLDERYNVPYAFGETYGEHKKFLEFTNKQLISLKKYSKESGIDFLVSGFDVNSFDFINNVLDVPIHKIPSPFVSHLPLLEHVAKYNKPIILATGMHDLNEVDLAMNSLKRHNEQILIMQCTSSYPCMDEEVHLNVLKTYRERYSRLVGYSSHDKGVILPVASVALGASAIEKHFTLDRTAIGPDHVASVEPRGLELIVKYIRTVEKGLGSYNKEILECEQKARIKYGFSCYANRIIEKDETITINVIDFKVPGGGISPSNVDFIIGKKAKKRINALDKVGIDDIE